MGPFASPADTGVEEAGDEPPPSVFGVIDRIDRLNHIAGIDISSCDTVVLGTCRGNHHTAAWKGLMDVGSSSPAARHPGSPRGPVHPALSVVAPQVS